MSDNEVQVIHGGVFEDSRGQISFVNDFDVKDVVRMYNIIHSDTEIIRAWQGHQEETKYFRCISGSFVLAWKRIDDFCNPSDEPEAEHIIIKSDSPCVVVIPPGYANGLKALEVKSQLLVMSNFYLGESLDDKIRYDKDLWFDWSKF